jgi:hypothetical protein
MGCLILSQDESRLISQEDNKSISIGKIDAAKAPLVLSMSSAFFQSTQQEVHEFYTPTQAIETRVFGPVKTVFNNPKNHFFKRYESAASFVDGVVHGLFIPTLTVFSPSAAIGACLAAISELIIGIGSLGKAIYHLAKGETNKAKQYAWDGLSRLMLSPIMAVVSLLAMPVEVIRFFTRSIASLVHMAKNCGMATPPAPMNTVEPLVPMSPTR